MATTIRDFRVELYLEHLEEASFLYEQKLSLPQDPELSWRDVRDVEERLEAHLDALVVGGDLALRVCRTRAVEGDAGERHAALRVFCRQGERGAVEEVLDALDVSDEEAYRAVRDALRWEWPAEWNDELVARGLGAPGLRRLGHEVLAYRRADAAFDPAWFAAEEGDEPGEAALWYALGRLEGEPVRRVWERVPPPRTAAGRAAHALACLRQGRSVPSGDAAPLPAALGEGAARAAELRARLARAPEPDVCLALGLLGDPADVEPLIAALAREELAESAALALFAITGVAVREEVFVPDEAEDEDEDAPPDAEETPGADAPATGETIVRLARDPAVWSTWWDEHRADFPAGRPRRLGRPLAPPALVHALTDDGVPYVLRRLAIEELRVRWGYDARLEIDHDVAEQERQLAAAQRWATGPAAAMPSGVWTFQGRPVEA